MATVKLDAIDRKILEILQTNAKITNAQLSKDVGLSPAPTLERVKKLENSGLIESYHAQLNAPMIGLGVSAFVTISLQGHRKEHIDAFVKRIMEVPEVVECHHITGQGDFLIKVVAVDLASYQKLLVEVINDIPEIDNTQTTMVLSTFKNAKVMPIGDHVIVD